MALDAAWICCSVGLIAKRRSKFVSPKSLRKSLKNCSVASTANLAASKLEEYFIKSEESSGTLTEDDNEGNTQMSLYLY